MPRFRPEEILEATTGVVHRPGKRKNLDGISIDSRTLRPGMIFVPVVGERYDAHTFIPQALEAGASAVIVEQKRVRPEMLERAVGRWIFAVGDIRHGSAKRVAAAVGEGSASVAMVHKYLESV